MTTALGAWGLPRSTGPFTAKAPAIAGQITQLGAWGGPSKRYLVPGKAISASAFPAVTDTWLGSFTEDPNTTINLAAFEAWTVAFNDVRTVTRIQLSADAWGPQWLDSSSVQVVNVTVKAGTDTWTTSFTETSTLVVSVSVTDTFTVSFTDSGAVVVNALDKAVTDTWTVALDDAALFISIADVSIITSDSWIARFNDFSLLETVATPIDDQIVTAVYFRTSQARTTLRII